MKGSIKKNAKFDTLSVHWVLNYHKLTTVHAFKNELPDPHSLVMLEKLWAEVVTADNHTSDTFQWVQQQSQFITQHGWDAWWKSDGPLGKVNNKKKD